METTRADSLLVNLQNWKKQQLQRKNIKTTKLCTYWKGLSWGRCSRRKKWVHILRAHRICCPHLQTSPAPGITSIYSSDPHPKKRTQSNRLNRDTDGSICILTTTKPFHVHSPHHLCSYSVDLFQPSNLWGALCKDQGSPTSPKG